MFIGSVVNVRNIFGSLVVLIFLSMFVNLFANFFFVVFVGIGWFDRGGGVPFH